MTSGAENHGRGRCLTSDVDACVHRETVEVAGLRKAREMCLETNAAP